MNDEIELRPEVLWFAEMMEKKLREHDDDRGSSWKNGWSTIFLIDLYAHVTKLDDAMRSGDKGRILSAAADCGNFAMFIADICGALLAEVPE